MNFNKNVNIKHAFIEFALNNNALLFGEFKLKSGRISPYFFNAGVFSSGNTLRTLGEFYATLLQEKVMNIRHLFGPAYKGIPLASSTAIALSNQGIDVDITFDRKETKDHGEGGDIIGAPLNGPVIMIDDVITAGTAYKKAKACIEKHGGSLKAIIIALDRCEKGENQTSAISDIKANGIDVYSLITFYDLIDYFKSERNTLLETTLTQYIKEYGV